MSVQIIGNDLYGITYNYIFQKCQHASNLGFLVKQHITLIRLNTFQFHIYIYLEGRLGLVVSCLGFLANWKNWDLVDHGILWSAMQDSYTQLIL